MRHFKLEYLEDDYKSYLFSMPDDCIITQVLKQSSFHKDRDIPFVGNTILIECNADGQDAENGFRAQYIDTRGKRWNVLSYGDVPYFHRKDKVT